MLCTVVSTPGTGIQDENIRPRGLSRPRLSSGNTIAAKLNGTYRPTRWLAQRIGLSAKSYQRKAVVTTSIGMISLVILGGRQGLRANRDENKTR